MTVLAGMLSDLPFSASRISHVEGGTAWITGTLGGSRAELCAGFDAGTGQPKAGSAFARGIALDGARWLDIALPRSTAPGARLCVRDRATGKETGAVELPGTLRVMARCLVLDGRLALLVNDQANLVVVDVDALRVVRSIPLPEPETLARRTAALVRAGGQSWLVRVRAARGVTELSPIDPRSGATGPGVVLEGKARAIAGAEGGFVALTERETGTFAEVVSLLPVSGPPSGGGPSFAGGPPFGGGPSFGGAPPSGEKGSEGRERLVLPLSEHGCLSAGGSLFVVGETGTVNLVQAGGGGFSWTRVPLPDNAKALDAEVWSGGVLVATWRRLVSLARPPFTPGGPHLLDLLARAAPPAAPSASPGVVVFAGPSLVAVDHPEYKRVNLRLGAGGAAGYARGQKVYFDEVDIPPTGVVTARAWHREGEPPKPRAEAAPVLFPAMDWAPFVPPPGRPASGDPESRQARTALDTLARDLDFTPSPLLRTVVERHDRDGAFRSLLGGLSFDLQIRDTSSATEFWPRADPCLSDLATDEDGNAFSFYDYPPLRGAPPPVIEWVHDDVPNVQWRGPDFDSFFADWLFRCGEHRREVVAGVLEELGLPATWPRENTVPPPPWLAATFGPVDLDGVSSAERAGDLLRAERLLVGAVTQTYDDAAAAPLTEWLARLYETLGWSRQRATLLGARR